jgi:hypothetical protein
MSFFRRLLRKLGPGWLVKDQLPPTMPDGGSEVDSRSLWTVALTLDAQLQRMRDGIGARYPGNPPAGAKLATTNGAPDDALGLIGRDRLIRRGPSEPVANYVARLQRAIDDHRVRGNAWAMLEQIQGFLAPRAVKVAYVNEHGNFYTLDADGTQTRNKYTDWDWDGSALTDAWARFWIVIYCESGSPFEPGPTWGDSQLWGGGWGGAGYTWGSTATVDHVFGVRAILDDWLMAGSRGVAVVLSFDDSDFAPSDTAPPLPDGTWRNYGKTAAGIEVNARNVDGRYWKGTGP